MRRLYDIINIFKSLGLIKKEVHFNGKNDVVWKGYLGFKSMYNKLKQENNIIDKENTTIQP